MLLSPPGDLEVGRFLRNLRHFGRDSARPSQKCLKCAMFAPCGRAARRGGRVPQEPRLEERRLLWECGRDVSGVDENRVALPGDVDGRLDRLLGGIDLEAVALVVGAFGVDVERPRLGLDDDQGAERRGKCELRELHFHSLLVDGTTFARQQGRLPLDSL